ncbi:hypothetical protein BAE44_0002719 [Dichanthelium oligosanthes]|uniref:Uncharacterized protein n=1 Tax=Dichanthelium oligosanthes TaxID=888268 RepID=A0A1E5WFU2_9POAL|nr:hypothetical protein BAE44_0002719 [Dichanthelium oligosanthes]
MRAAAATLLLALVVAAATASDAARMADDLATVNAGGHGHGHGHRGRTWRDHHDGNRSPLAGLTECVAVCGSGVTACMLDCYKPAVTFDPVQLPVCLLGCTNDALICGSSCSTNM